MLGHILKVICNNSLERKMCHNCTDCNSILCRLDIWLHRLHKGGSIEATVAATAAAKADVPAYIQAFISEPCHIVKQPTDTCSICDSADSTQIKDDAQGRAWPQ